MYYLSDVWEHTEGGIPWSQCSTRTWNFALSEGDPISLTARNLPSGENHSVGRDILGRDRGVL